MLRVADILSPVADVLPAVTNIFVVVFRVFQTILRPRVLCEELLALLGRHALQALTLHVLTNTGVLLQELLAGLRRHPFQLLTDPGWLLTCLAFLARLPLLTHVLFCPLLTFLRRLTTPAAVNVPNLLLSRRTGPSGCRRDISHRRL